MEIVINIPKDLYDQIKWREEEIRKHKKYVICKAILDGTVIPKEHGRLIDAEKLMDALRANVAVSELCGIEKAEDDLDEAPTVIEADKEE